MTKNQRWIPWRCSSGPTLSASNQSHEVYARNSWAAWDFLSQFSRNEDGTISVSPVSYARAASDGSVVDNSYN